MTATSSDETARPASLSDAIVPLFALVLSIGAALTLFGPVEALEGPIQVGLIICCAIAALIAMTNGHKWSVVEEVGEGAMSSITSAILILLAVGALIGAWNLSGTIPTLVYYGIQILSPGYYYLAAVLLCGALSMSIGSSWTVAGNSPRKCCPGWRPTAVPDVALVPWNSCGAFMAAVLGVSTIAYLPFAVFNYVAPVLSVIYGIIGFKIARKTPVEEAEEKAV